MGGNDDPTAITDCCCNLNGRPSFHEGECGAKAEKMSIGRGDLHTRDNQESINGPPIFADESAASEVLHGIAGVVIGDGDSAEASVFGSLDHGLW